jgi:hypothetical protein
VLVEAQVAHWTYIFETKQFSRVAASIGRSFDFLPVFDCFQTLPRVDLSEESVVQARHDGDREAIGQTLAVLALGVLHHKYVRV